MKREKLSRSTIKRRFFIFLIIFIIIAACSSPPEKTLNDKLRPYQTGSEINIAANEYDTSPTKGSCSYGFHAISYGEIGLVTALHCTNTNYDYEGNFIVTGERVWQSYADDAYAVAKVKQKPILFNKRNDNICREAIEELGRGDLYWCLRADAAFAPFIYQSIANDDDLYQAGAVANVPLSIDETNLGPVMQDDPHFYTGYSYVPFSNEGLYKIGMTTGKTVGYLVSEISLNIPLALEQGGEVVVLLGVYGAQSSNAATFADLGDSGGPVFHSTNGNDGPFFTLTGIVSAGTGYGLLFVEPLGDILASIDIEVEYATGNGGYLGTP